MRKEEKMLKKGRLAAAYSKLDDRLQLAVIEEYQRLLLENKGMDASLKKHMNDAILPAVSFYRVLQSNGYSRKEAFQMIRKSVLETAKPMEQFLESFGKFPLFFPIFRRMCKLSTKTSYGGKGWSFLWKQNTPNKIEWECRSCVYFNQFCRYEMQELTTIFCESDDVVYGNIKNARWGRTQTIGRGAEFCDFRFYREGR